MAKDLEITINPETDEIELGIMNERLIINGFLTTTEGSKVKLLDPEQQKKVAKFILKNIL